MRVGHVVAMMLASTGVAPAQVAPPVPIAVPAPNLTGSPIVRGTFDRHQLTLAPGASAIVHLFGASSTTLSVSGSAVDVHFDGPSRTVAVTARALGDATITGTDPGGGSDTIVVHVVAPAGTIPSDVTVSLAGAPARDFIVARLRAELRPLLHLCAACTFDLPGAAALDPTQTAQRLDVRLRGANAAAVFGATTLHLALQPYAPMREPVTLLYSDDPESVGSDGVLFRSTQPIDEKHPARLYAYHAAADAGRSVYIIVATAGAQSDVQLIGGAVGPYGDYHCVGHSATTTYLARRALHEGMQAHLTPDAPLVLRLNARAMPAHTLVTGIYDVDVTGGDAVRVAVVTASGDADPLALLNGKQEPSDGHARRGEYDLTTVKPLTLRYSAGQPNESTIAAGGGGGEGELMQLTAEYPALHGEFGVLRTIDVHLQNPTAVQQSVNLYVTPVNGPDTLTMWFQGDLASTEIGRLADPAVRTLVRTFSLAPGTSQDASALFMADGSSWFPIEIGLTPVSVAAPPANAFDTCARALTDQVSLVR